MIELALTDEAEAYGKRVKREYDRRGVTDTFRRSGADRRWTGHAVEFAVAEWLASQGIPHVWNGGLDNKPDFVLGGEGGIRVASKANSGNGPREDFIFTVPEHHIYKLGDGALFSIIQLRYRTIWIAGYIGARDFRLHAERHRAGDDGFIAGRPFEHDCRTISADALQPAELFFDLLRVACA